MVPATKVPTAATIDLKLEVVILPVSDVDRAKQFYQGLGWRLDADIAFDNGFRVVQFTPSGSGCSIQFGTNIRLERHCGTARQVGGFPRNGDWWAAIATVADTR